MLEPFLVRDFLRVLGTSLPGPRLSWTRLPKASWVEVYLDKTSRAIYLRFQTVALRLFLQPLPHPVLEPFLVRKFLRFLGRVFLG